MLIIGIAGGSGSGKTTVVRAITDRLKEKVVVIPQDAYYKDSSDLTDEEKRNQNFDHPDAIDWDLLCDQMAELREGRPYSNRCIPISAVPAPRPKASPWLRPTSS